jgi:hypothetical protein
VMTAPTERVTSVLVLQRRLLETEDFTHKLQQRALHCCW